VATKKCNWQLTRNFTPAAPITTDAMGVTTGRGSKPADAVDVNSEYADSIQFIASGVGTGDTAIVLAVYAGTDDGPAELVGTFTLLLGSSQMLVDPSGQGITVGSTVKYADSVVITTNNDLIAAFIPSALEANGIATWGMDLLGRDWIAVRLNTNTAACSQLTVFHRYIGSK
jgi:hypothetical protein